MQTKNDKFPKWVENVENKEIKIEFYKKKINKMIAKLEHEATPQDRMLYFNDDEESFEDFTFDEEFFDGNEEFV